MDIRERADLILNCLQYCNEKYADIPGIKISKIKDIFLKAHDIFIPDSDIQELFQKKYVEYYDLPNMDVYIYIHGFNGNIKITTKGTEHLREGEELKKISPQLIQLI